MAIEFGSRKETFDNFKVYETMLAGRPFKVEMGKMCGLSNASALIRYGETCVMCNVVMSPKPREGVDFFPLNVEYEEKLYAAGRIPGSFMRREGRPGERAILTSRVVDRPMRPLFPKEMRNDVCITMTVMSLDPDCSPEIAGMIGASLVTAVSDIPWNGPIGGVQVGLVDGEIVLNPTQEQRKVSDLALTVAATMDKIVMIEAGANEVDEDTMLNAIKAAHVEIKKIIEFINRIVAERGKPKIDFQVVGLDMDVFHAIQNKYLDDFKAAMDTDDKNVRDAALLPIMDRIAEEYPDLTAADLDLVSYKMQKFVVRRWLLDEGKRVDGRGINEIRPLAAEVGILPRVHGSGMFTRGQTQVLTTCTLGGTKDNQLMDDLTDEQTKRYIHHYNFPPYSVGEARAPRSPGRREIGHGALAERALVPVLFALNLFWGSVSLAPGAVLTALLGKGGDVLAGNIILQLRLPRAVMAALLGAALSAAGYLLQTFFANPIAGPFVMGVSSGAKLAVALTMVVFLDRGMLTSSATMIVAAFAGAMAAMAFVLAVARRVQRMSILVICGVMIGYICSAVTDIVVAFAQDSNIVNLHNWSQGSFSGMTWANVQAAALVTLPVLAAAFLLSKPMAAYQMGEEYARSVGVNVRLFSAVLVLLSSLLAACVTAFAGPISFVGIAVPHLVKQLLGSAKPLHVLPGCCLGGAAFCLFCDLLARSLFAPTELSISSVTAVFGAPVVIWLLVRRSQEGAR